MELTIKITEEDLMQAAENVVYFINYNQNLHPDSEIDEKAITQCLASRDRSHH